MFTSFWNCESFHVFAISMKIVKTWNRERGNLESDYIQESANVNNCFGNKFYNCHKYYLKLML